MPRNFERNDQISAKNVHSAAPSAVGRWRAIGGGRGVGVPARRAPARNRTLRPGFLPGGARQGVSRQGALGVRRQDGATRRARLGAQAPGAGARSGVENGRSRNL